MRIPLKNLKSEIGKKVTVIGWVNSFRKIGKMCFIELRDRDGLIQINFFKESFDQYDDLLSINKEDLVEINGLLQLRDENYISQGKINGNIEIIGECFKIISKSDILPFDFSSTNTSQAFENLRMEYRYLDMRSKRILENIKMRSNINNFFRNFLINRDFLEVETPCLTKGTPEGSREFIVPSRIHSGKYYVLPQSPQQFKQLLMVGGLEKYFQIARCFRDEDSRGDRQPEFTQLDMELSFINQSDIMKLVEGMLIQLVSIYYPDYKIQEIPFPIMTFDECMKKYGSDKPDIREDKSNNKLLAFLWVVDFPLFEYSDTEGKIVACHHPFTRPQGSNLDEKNPLDIKAEAYDIVLNGFEIGGGSIRIHEIELQNKVFEVLGLTKDAIDNRFGHLLKAFKFSPPPHGGIALGIDRILSILQNEQNIREVIAFPKTGDGKDLLMGAPSYL